MRIEAIYISPGHNFFGHHGMPAGGHAMTALLRVECVAGKGLVGDRFFGHKEDYKGQINVFAMEVYEDLCRRLGVADRDPSVFRRNVLTRGVDLNSLIGKTFTVQGIEFAGVAECTPCYWMDQAFAPGAEDALQNRGGLRARILSDGFLETGK
ncbi:MAG: molybdenum cofactor biosysynthesis protein [Blastochloris sp.]|nr:molybdenum cofactor biosysynthesis protein [Blastochloris sp.]